MIESLCDKDPNIYPINRIERYILILLKIVNKKIIKSSYVGP